MATAEFKALLPESSFAQAKTNLSAHMTEVVQRHRPLVVDRNHGRERAVLVDEGDLTAVLERHTFNPRVSVSDGEFVVRLPELNLIAGAHGFDEAMSTLVTMAEEYVEAYLERVDFYLQTDRRSHLPWVLRIALTPRDRRPELIAPATDQATAADPPAR